MLLEDDGIGPYVARLLTACYEFEKGVEVADLGTPALDLIDEISGKDAVILIDSVKSGEPAGTVLLYRKDDIIRHTPQVRMDPHSPALVETLLSADLFGIAPPEVLLVGVTGGSYGAGCNLSAPVKASVARAIVEVLNELDRLGIHYECRQHPIDPSIWWAPAEEERLSLQPA